MARVNIEQSVWTDPRFKALGKCMGSDVFGAIGRMAAVWNYCTERKTFLVSKHILAAIADCDAFSNYLVICELGEEVDGQIRIRGTKGRIEWLSTLRKNGKKGGRPKKTRSKPDGLQNKTTAEPPLNPLTLTLTPTLTNNNIYTAKTSGPLDFKKLADKYPRPDGKAVGLKRCAEQIKTPEDYEALSKAIDNYVAHCKKHDQFLKHFDSFLGTKRSGYPWRDYIEATGPPSSKKVVLKFN